MIIEAARRYFKEKGGEEIRPAPNEKPRVEGIGYVLSKAEHERILSILDRKRVGGF